MELSHDMWYVSKEWRFKTATNMQRSFIGNGPLMGQVMKKYDEKN